MVKVAGSSPSRVALCRSGINVINKSKTFPRRQIHSARIFHIPTLLLSKLTSVTAGKLTARKHVSNIHRCKEKMESVPGDKIMKEETVQRTVAWRHQTITKVRATG
jgi:hypothetical protein